jgi:hypothetical protein
MKDKRILGPVRAGANDLAGLPIWTAAYLEKHRQLAKWMRVPCGARRRRDGLPCQAKSEPGKRRCRWHGGCSTGPRTPEGIARVTANLPKRHKVLIGPPKEFTMISPHTGG